MYVFRYISPMRYKLIHTGTLPWRLGLVVSSPPATEETGAMGREIESRRGRVE
jgi:hypothetical protein